MRTATNNLSNMPIAEHLVPALLTDNMLDFVVSDKLPKTYSVSGHSQIDSQENFLQTEQEDVTELFVPLLIVG